MSASGHASPEDRRALWLAAGWGLAEATCFFIVPDVLLSRLALRKPRLALTACFAAMVAAVAGGLLLYWLGATLAPRTALLSAADWLPGISPPMMESARAGLEQRGLAALFVGVLQGIPYKLFAVQAAPIGVFSFVLVSAAARLARFLAVTIFSALAGGWLVAKFGPAATLRLHAGVWIAFYAFYFWRIGI
jgi:membrane protein YqaA with SNARE-associated domain